MKKIILLIIVTAFIFSCSSEDRLDGFITSKSYIDRFIYSERLEYFQHIYGDGLEFILELKGENITSSTNPEEFDRLINSYNDISFNEKKLPIQYVIKDIFSTVTVTAEKDFNGFKSGENITDFYIYAASLYDYLLNGYTFEENLSEKDAELIHSNTLGNPPYYRRFVKKIDTITEADMTLIYPRFSLFYKNEIPDETNKFYFTITNNEKSLDAKISLTHH